MDLLSAVMRELNLSAARYRRLGLAEPWALAFDQAGLRGVHVVLKGNCEVAFDQGPALPLQQGDLVVAPRADPHVLRSKGSKLKPIPAGNASNDDGEASGEEKAIILCGAFAFSETAHPSLAGLPRMLHVPGSDGKPARWLRGYIDALLTEVGDDGPGSDVVMARLSAAIVTRALRENTIGADNPGWLRGLSDPFIAKALSVMHEDCGSGWTVERLGRTVGMSRAAFAERFGEFVGEPPMRYLFRLRMQKAGQMLREGKALSQISDAVGYGSEAAFSTAFRRHTGMAPGRFRDEMPNGQGSKLTPSRQ